MQESCQGGWGQGSGVRGAQRGNCKGFSAVLLSTIPSSHTRGIAATC